jgi:hypothetical protein
MTSKDDKELEEYRAKKNYLKSLQPHEYITYFISRQTMAIVTQLRIIKWLLGFIVLTMALRDPFWVYVISFGHSGHL